MRRIDQSSAFAFCSTVYGGIQRRPNALADSRSTPVGSPVAVCSMIPPGGLGVERVIPARRRAAELTHRPCRLISVRTTGLSGAAASRAFQSGWLPSELVSHWPPRIHSPLAWVAEHLR